MSSRVRREWCSEAALRYACGMSVTQAIEALKEGGYKGWGGCSELAVSTALGGGPAELGQPVTVRRFAEDHPEGRYVVMTSTHYLAVVDGLVGDNHRAPTPPDRHPNAGMRVTAYWRTDR